MRCMYRVIVGMFVLLFALSFAMLALAQNRPLCPIDETTGRPILENIQGVCFLDMQGSTWVWADGQKVLFVYSYNTGVNDFVRFNSQGKGFVHAQDRDNVIGALCPNPPCAWPPGSSEEWFMGSGTLTVNTGSTKDFFAICPVMMKFKGELADQFGTGNQVNVHAFLTVVKDPELVCKISLVRIDVDPPID